MNKGSIIQIMGPVVDMSFEGGELPALYNAINLKNPQTNNCRTPTVQLRGFGWGKLPAEF